MTKARRLTCCNNKTGVILTIEYRMTVKALTEVVKDKSFH